MTEFSTREARAGLKWLELIRTVDVNVRMATNRKLAMMKTVGIPSKLLSSLRTYANRLSRALRGRRGGRRCS